MINPGRQIATVSTIAESVFDGIFDISNLRSATLHVTGTFALSLVVEVSNDNTAVPEHWTEVSVSPAGGGPSASKIDAPGMYSVSLGYRFFRMKCTDYTSGTAEVSAIFSQEASLDLSGGQSSPTDRYKFTDYDDSGTTQYFGYVDEKGAWYIMSLDTSNKEARYAKGESGYGTAWSGREGLSYGYFYEIF